MRPLFVGLGFFGILAAIGLGIAALVIGKILVNSVRKYIF